MDPANHLVCYDLHTKEKVDRLVWVENQLGKQELEVNKQKRRASRDLPAAAVRQPQEILRPGERFRRPENPPSSCCHPPSVTLLRR